MATRTTHHRRVAPGVLAAGLLLLPLTGCGDEPDPVDATPEVTETEPAPDGGTDDPAETPEPQDPAATGDTAAEIDCSTDSCSLTLTGSGAETEVFGTPVVLDVVEDGRASVRVGDQEVACSQGESVSAGPLTLACTTVTEDSVTMTASLG